MHARRVICFAYVFFLYLYYFFVVNFSSENLRIYEIFKTVRALERHDMLVIHFEIPQGTLPRQPNFRSKIGENGDPPSFVGLAKCIAISPLRFQTFN